LTLKYDAKESYVVFAGETDRNNEDYSSKTANSHYNSLNNTQLRKRIPKVAFLPCYLPL